MNFHQGILNLEAGDIITCTFYDEYEEAFKAIRITRSGTSITSAFAHTHNTSDITDADNNLFKKSIIYEETVQNSGCSYTISELGLYLIIGIQPYIKDGNVALIFISSGWIGSGTYL